jgi:hypothetical protein
MALMSEQVLAQLRFEAAEVADRTSPLHVLDTVILAILVGIGWTAGRAWWLLVFGSVFAAKGLVTYAYAVRHGYRAGMMKQLKPVVPAQGAAPPASRPTSEQMLENDRIADHQTPFGVPFGPNVQAYSEPALYLVTPLHASLDRKARCERA